MAKGFPRTKTSGAHKAVQRGHGSGKTKAMSAKASYPSGSAGNTSSYTGTGKNYSQTSSGSGQMGRNTK